jgi:hypothetical protein
MTEKAKFLSFRLDDGLFVWVKNHATANNLSISDVIREALFILKGIQESQQQDQMGQEFKTLKSEIGNVFKIVDTPDGILFERIKPGIAKLG